MEENRGSGAMANAVSGSHHLFPPLPHNQADHSNIRSMDAVVNPCIDAGHNDLSHNVPPRFPGNGNSRNGEDLLYGASVPTSSGARALEALGVSFKKKKGFPTDNERCSLFLVPT
ncbi:hypothetical protein Leryth_006046 [Lithospermum erythrorhizon]|nr:hypothetical protein Leryth_006046 [Lithospermum erythrorhizon]